MENHGMQEGYQAVPPVTVRTGPGLFGYATAGVAGVSAIGVGILGFKLRKERKAREADAKDLKALGEKHQKLNDLVMGTDSVPGLLRQISESNELMTKINAFNHGLAAKLNVDNIDAQAETQPRKAAPAKKTE